MSIFGHTLYIVTDKDGYTVFTNRENVCAYPNKSDALNQANHLNRKEPEGAPHKVVTMERQP